MTVPIPPDTQNSSNATQARATNAPKAPLAKIVLGLLLLVSLVFNGIMAYQLFKNQPFPGQANNCFLPTPTTAVTFTPSVNATGTLTPTVPATGTVTSAPGAPITLQLVTQDSASMPGPDGTTPDFEPVTTNITVSSFNQAIPLNSFGNVIPNSVTVVAFDNYAAAIRFNNLMLNPSCFPAQSDTPCTLILRKGGSINMNTMTLDARTSYTLNFE